MKSIFAFLYGLAFGTFGIVCLVFGYLKGAETNKRDFRPKYSGYFYNKRTSNIPDPFDYYREREE